MSCESTVLQWKNYTPTASEAFERLYEDLDFTDVTIACEDNKKIEAHKVILNMCSSLFGNILKDNPNPHPLIYLQGVIIEDLILLKTFMYKGKATVLKKQLDSFMKLSKTYLNSSQESTYAKSIKSPQECKPTFEKKIIVPNFNPPLILKQHENNKDLEELSGESISSNLMEDNIRENVEHQQGDSRFLQTKLKRERLKCKQCDFSTLFVARLAQHNKKRHREVECPTCGIVLQPKLLTKHITDKHTMFYCENCSYSSKFKGSIQIHNRKHTGQMIQCDQCEYSCAKAYSLHLHMENKHQTSEYNCDSCDFVGHNARRVLFHKKKVHKGIRYSCELCDHKATKRVNLRAHQQRVHAKVRFSCQLCQFGDSQMSRVKLHGKRKHGISFGEHKTL